MHALKGLLVAGVFAVLAPSALALNGGAPPNGVAGPNIIQGAPAVPDAAGTPCSKASKPKRQLSPEERAQRKAMRAQRIAEGQPMPPKRRSARRAC